MRRILLVVCLLPALALAAILWASVAGAAQSDVVMTALSCSTSPELIVLKNNGTSPVTLTGFHIVSDPITDPEQNPELGHIVPTINAGQSIILQSGPGSATNAANNTYQLAAGELFRDNDTTDFARLERADHSTQQINCPRSDVTPTATSAVPGSSPTPTATPSPTATPTPSGPRAVSITALECQANPQFVQIKNSGNVRIPLNGFRLQSDPITAPGQDFALSGSITPNETQTYMADSAAVENGETIFLIITAPIYRHNGAPDYAKLVRPDGSSQTVYCGTLPSGLDDGVSSVTPTATPQLFTPTPQAPPSASASASAVPSAPASPAATGTRVAPLPPNTGAATGEDGSEPIAPLTLAGGVLAGGGIALLVLRRRMARR